MAVPGIRAPDTRRRLTASHWSLERQPRPVTRGITPHNVGSTEPGRHAALKFKALEDIRFVRALLDTAERNAVRAARHHGRSWTDVASALGVSRQSAWERWRDDAE